MKTSWQYYALLLLLVEKIIQHIFVTLAFYFNWGDIASTVKVPPAVLMVTGALVALLLIFSLWGVLMKKAGTINLVIFLALFDIIGEFVGQGRIGIEITISFIVALLLLIIALSYRHRTRQEWV